MQLKNFIVAALAATVVAERAPYKLSTKSVKSTSLVALAARQEPGYQPEQTLCGAGDTCTEACGSGFEQCASTDGVSHCFNKGAGETCCQDAKGNACEAGYYCAVDETAETWCCPDGMSASDCAAKFAVTGGLSSQIPTATPTAAATTTATSSETLSTSGASTSHSNGTVAQGHANGTTTVGSSVPTSIESPIQAAAAGSLVASGAFAAFFALAASFL